MGGRKLNYVDTVVDHLMSSEGLEQMLIPADYAAILELEKEEIPLDFVLNSISRNIRSEASVGAEPATIQSLSTKVILEFADSLKENAAFKDLTRPSQ